MGFDHHSHRMCEKPLERNRHGITEAEPKLFPDMSVSLRGPAKRWLSFWFPFKATKGGFFQDTRHAHKPKQNRGQYQTKAYPKGTKLRPTKSDFFSRSCQVATKATDKDPTFWCKNTAAKQRIRNHEPNGKGNFMAQAENNNSEVRQSRRRGTMPQTWAVA